MNIKICIPTYNRKSIETLKMLIEFDTSDIFVFVNNWDNEEKAKTECERLKKQYEGVSIFENVNFVPLMTKGIPAARNGILDYFKDNEKIVMIDDDVTKVLKLTAGTQLKGEVKQVESVKEFFEEAFDKLEKFGTNLWGVYPINNPFFMSNKLDNKGFIIGTMFGVIKSNLRFDERLKLKEDYDFTLQHIIKYKKVCRFNNITIKAGHYTNDGGCVEQRKENPELEKECAELILMKHPRYLKKNPSRDNEILITL